MHERRSGTRMYGAISNGKNASTPNGLYLPPRSCIGSGISPTKTLTRTITIPESQASGCHPLDGNLPSGNSKNTNVPRSPTKGTHNQLLIPAAPNGNGTEPGLATPSTA